MTGSQNVRPETTRQFRKSYVLGSVALGLLLTTFVTSIGAAYILDVWIQRGGGSVNTMVPGYTYAAATAMKVGIFETVAFVIAAVVQWFRDRNSITSYPVLGLAAVHGIPFSIFCGGVLVLLFQWQYTYEPDLLARSSAASRSAVFGMIAVLLFGIAAGIFSLVRREQPRSVPGIAIVFNLALILIFRYFEFYKLDFDQDRWAE